MFIRFWGARGSIPVSGREYLKYGGDSTCVELRTTNGEVVIIDAGSGIRGLGNLLVEEGISTVHLLFTHFHWDHVIGFPFFKPLYRSDMTINVLGCPASQGSFEAIFSRLMRHPYFPVPFGTVKGNVEYEIRCEPTLEIDDMAILPIALNHTDPGLGYRFSDSRSSFVFLTDNELGHVHNDGRSFDEYASFSANADLLVHDAEYTAQDYAIKKGWGHSLYTDALRLAQQAGVKRFGLFHHNQDRVDAELDAMVADCRHQLAEKRDTLECFAVEQGMTFDL